MRLADSWVTTGEHVVKKPTAWAPLFCDAQAVFLCHRKLRPMTQKRSAKDRTAAERKSAAVAPRRRRRILQAGFFLIS